MPFKDPARMREYQRLFYAARRRAWLKANGPCRKCGSSVRLEVDHIDPAKKVSHKVWSWAEARRLAELAKCQVLCHRCHLEKTIGGREPPHGTHARYVHLRCRCTPCRAAHAVTNAKYR